MNLEKVFKIGTNAYYDRAFIWFELLRTFEYLCVGLLPFMKEDKINIFLNDYCNILIYIIIINFLTYKFMFFI